MKFSWLNEMDPMDRFKTILRGEKPDRVGVFPLMMGHSAIACGYPNLGDYYAKADVSVRCQMLAKELYGHDEPVHLVSPGSNAGEWGSKIEHPYRPKMGAIATIESVAKTPNDIENLVVPDPNTAPYMQEYTKMIQLAIDKKQFPFVFVYGGWLSHAAPRIAELEQVLIWMHKAPDLVDKLLDKDLEWGIRQAEYFVKKFDSETWLPWDPNPTDSNTLISPSMFARFPMPRAIKLHQKVLDLGLPMWFTHWCSNHKGNMKAGYIEKIPQGKPGIIQFGPEVDLQYTVDHYGDKYIILGNVDPPSCMLKSFDEVYALCKRDVEIGKKSPKGYFLSCGCELPPRTPSVNAYAFMKAARDFGKY